MISIYPPIKSKHVKLSGVASYTKNLITNMSNNNDVIVFADSLPKGESSYNDEEVMICRCWNKGINYPFQIFRKILRYKLDIIHIQHEFYLYGGLVSAIIFPLFLFFLSFLRLPVIVTLHGVMPLSNVDQKFLTDNWIKGKPFSMKIGMLFLIKFIVLLSSSIIVHEEKIKQMLIHDYRCKDHKINVIPHGIEEKKSIVLKNLAKEKIGIKEKRVILFFGYITGYKNVRLLIESAKYLKTSDWIIIIAGGPHPRLINNPDYKRYLLDLRETANMISKDNFMFKDFIPEEKVQLFFSAADLIVFPYNLCMHSSGPLSLAISYGTPFIISDCFYPIILNKRILFRNEIKELSTKIDMFFSDNEFQLESLRYCQELRKSIFWPNISLRTRNLYLKIIEY